MQYRPYVRAFAPYLDEEVVGVAEGAGLTLEEAYLLQLRAEAAAIPTAGPAPLPRLTASDDAGDECTSVAVLPEATGTDSGLIAHNADLPAFYREVGVVLEIVPDDAPAVLMLTPAGQVSYIGMNDRGLAVVANYLTCDGWRVGFPRYFLSRVALTHQTVDAAIAAVRAIPRASSRNLVMLDAHGTAADLETTPTEDARLDPEDGILAHANHYVAPALQAEERATPAYVQQLADPHGPDPRACRRAARPARRGRRASAAPGSDLLPGHALPRARGQPRPRRHDVRLAGRRAGAARAVGRRRPAEPPRVPAPHVQRRPGLTGTERALGRGNPSALEWTASDSLPSQLRVGVQRPDHGAGRAGSNRLPIRLAEARIVPSDSAARRS